MMNALSRYQAALQALTQSGASFSAEQALEILYARDVVQVYLQARSPVQIALLTAVMESDAQLKRYGYRIIRVLDLADCRAGLPKSPEGWWWHLETLKEVHPWGRWNGVVKGTSYVAWAASLGFLVNTASRFLGGAPAGFWGASAVSFSALLALLKAWSEFTQASQHNTARFIPKIKCLQRYQEEAKFGTTLLLFFLFGGVWRALPWFSEIYTGFGQEQACINLDGAEQAIAPDPKSQEPCQVHPGSAEQAFLRAIALNPDNLDARFYLGNLYEDLQEVEQARKQYGFAAKGNDPRALNNLGRLDIQAKAYPQAVARLEQGLQLLTDQSPQGVRYSLFKNLGWARFEQGRDQEAQLTLRAAIGVASDPAVQEQNTNLGSAHCLLAQVFERQKQKQQASEQWQRCCELGSRLNPDEDTWLYLAHQQLGTGGRSCQP